jgi:hypothetical protein
VGVVAGGNADFGAVFGVDDADFGDFSAVEENVGGGGGHALRGGGVTSADAVLPVSADFGADFDGFDAFGAENGEGAGGGFTMLGVDSLCMGGGGGNALGAGGGALGDPFALLLFEDGIQGGNTESASGIALAAGISSCLFKSMCLICP